VPGMAPGFLAAIPAGSEAGMSQVHAYGALSAVVLVWLLQRAASKEPRKDDALRARTQLRYFYPQLR
jgi:hypothetical protein